MVSEDWFDKDNLRLVAVTHDGRAVTSAASVGHPKNQLAS